MTIKPHFHYLHSESPKAERIYPHHGTTMQDLRHFLHEDPSWSVAIDREFNLYLYREKVAA